ncbi:hypothetical protein PNOK_0167500 [Pyrrhoderma noxium]|uniref:Uncharacterized protein n=1 Tax=Pyrrhoderma noxium TaxID=2282107 RepID=A0A286UQ53_9AGAM|nr:hypothetical protein PNOK_0167500 [Pyrrhoderma noxium]
MTTIAAVAIYNEVRGRRQSSVEVKSSVVEADGVEGNALIAEVGDEKRTSAERPINRYNSQSKMELVWITMT